MDEGDLYWEDLIRLSLTMLAFNYINHIMKNAGNMPILPNFVVSRYRLS